MATTRTRKLWSDPTGTAEPLYAHYAASRVALRWHDVCLIFPISSSLLHLGYNILSLEKKTSRTALKVWPGIPEQAVKRRTSPRGDDLHRYIEVFRTCV